MADTPEEIKAQVNDMILDRGFAIHYTEGDHDTRPVAYTIGRTMRGQPELLISGPFDSTLAESLLTAMVDREIVAGKAVDAAFGGPEGRTFPGFPIPIDPWDAEMLIALAVFGKITALQVLWPDDAGCFPGDPDYAVDPSSQRVF